MHTDGTERIYKFCECKEYTPAIFSWVKEQRYEGTRHEIMLMHGSEDQHTLLCNSQWVLKLQLVINLRAPW